MRNGMRERLAHMTDEELLTIVGDSTDQGWGAAGTALVDGTPVFLKRLPLTQLELEHPRSTKNRYRLPTYYSYGVGSAGFTSWRELAAHEATSELAGFPELLHQRVMPRTAAVRELPWSREQYVQYWRGSAAIGRFIAARDAAPQEIWVVLDHYPYAAQPWLLDNQQAIDEILRQVFEHVEELRELGIVHFDVHLNNVVGDGTTWHLTDFGLAMAQTFELTATERAFLDRHRYYDYANLLASLAYLLSAALGQTTNLRRLAASIDTLDDLAVRYDPAVKAALRRYRAPIMYMVDWWLRMRRPTKRSTYDDGEMRDLLRAAGIRT
jgi:hypothetical protein